MHKAGFTLEASSTLCSILHTTMVADSQDSILARWLSHMSAHDC